jgi:hypothetical protein
MLITHVFSSEIATIPSSLSGVQFSTVSLIDSDYSTASITFVGPNNNVTGNLTATLGLGASSPFSITNNNWGQSDAIAAGKATISLKFYPVTSGNFSDVLLLQFDSRAVSYTLSGSCTLNFQTFSYTGTVPTWTIPTTTTYSVEMWGGSGAAAINYGPCGTGAYIKSKISMTASNQVNVLVGASSPSGWAGGGSGGGTFLAYTNDSPILVAGGGGSSILYYGGRPGLTTNNGTTNAGTGTGGGSGFSQNNSGSTKSFINSKNGGQAAAAGFGGGGNLGGGGYNGGNVINEAFTNGAGGGGYLSGTVISAIDGGGPRSDGKVIIRWQ